MSKIEIVLLVLAGAFVVYMAVLSVVGDEAHAEGADGEQACWDYHRDITGRLRQTESPYVDETGAP